MAGVDTRLGVGSHRPQSDREGRRLSEAPTLIFDVRRDCCLSGPIQGRTSRLGSMQHDHTEKDVFYLLVVTRRGHTIQLSQCDFVSSCESYERLPTPHRHLSALVTQNTRTRSLMTLSPQHGPHDLCVRTLHCRDHERLQLLSLLLPLHRRPGARLARLLQPSLPKS